VPAFIRQWPLANWANWAAGPSCQHTGLVVPGDFVSCWAGTMGLDRSPALARRRARATTRKPPIDTLDLELDTFYFVSMLVYACFYKAC
jgi:hypothetical protein